MFSKEHINRIELDGYAVDDGFGVLSHRGNDGFDGPGQLPAVIDDCHWIHIAGLCLEEDVHGTATCLIAGSMALIALSTLTHVEFLVPVQMVKAILPHHCR